MSTWTLNLTIPATGNDLGHTWTPLGMPDATVGDELTVILKNPPSSFQNVSLNLSWTAGSGNPNPAVAGWDGDLQGDGTIQWKAFLINPTTSQTEPEAEYIFRAIVTVNPASSSPISYETPGDPEMIVRPQ